MTADRRADCLAALLAFPGQDEGDLQVLDEVLVEATQLPAQAELDAALLGIFERYPSEDGYGVYWSIVHGLERRGGYEPALLCSIRRKAVFFNTLMLGRMLTAGITLCAGESVEEVLEIVAQSEAADADARKNATDFLAHHRNRSTKA